LLKMFKQFGLLLVFGHFSNNLLVLGSVFMYLTNQISKWRHFYWFIDVTSTLNTVDILTWNNDLF
jgi:hypothetical protein